MDLKTREKLKKRNKAFLDDEAEEDEEQEEEGEQGNEKEDRIEIDKGVSLDDKENEDDVDDLGTLALEEDDDDEDLPDTLVLEPATGSTNPGLNADDNKISSLGTELSGLTQEMSMAPPRFTPLRERSDAVKEKPPQSSAAKKNLFEGLFDASDPQIEDVDDVVGLCSGQFATQKTQGTQDTEDTQNTQDTQGIDTQEIDSQPSTDCPDTLILNRASGEKGEKNDDTVTAAGVSILDSDDEENDAKRSKKRRKRVAVVSDDSESEEEQGPNFNRNVEMLETKCIFLFSHHHHSFTRGSRLSHPAYHFTFS